MSIQRVSVSNRILLPETKEYEASTEARLVGKLAEEIHLAGLKIVNSHSGWFHVGRRWMRLPMPGEGYQLVDCPEYEADIVEITAWCEASPRTI